MNQRTRQNVRDGCFALFWSALATVYISILLDEEIPFATKLIATFFTLQLIGCTCLCWTRNVCQSLDRSDEESFWDDSDEEDIENQIKHGVSTDKLLSLGSFRMKETQRKSFAVDPDDVDPACAICLSEYTGEHFLTKLPCNHVFHNECILQWLADNTKCPLCVNDVEDLMDNANEEFVTEFELSTCTQEEKKETIENSVITLNAPSSDVTPVLECSIIDGAQKKDTDQAE